MKFTSFIAFVFLWGRIIAQNASISINDHDLLLEIDEKANLTFQVSNLTKVVNVTFSTSSVVQVIPSSVLVSPESPSFSVDIKATEAGKTTVTVLNSSSITNVDLLNAFVRVTVQHDQGLDIFSQVIGWIYFVAWSISFYPQIYENWKRKSVIGLSFDFLGLNVIGFSLYSLFNIGLYWIPPIEAEYFSRHPTGVNPVQLNDVIFSIHAVFACIVTIVQCSIYERGNQKVSRTCKLILAAIFLFILVTVILALTKVVEYLDFLYYCSYVKLFITLIKYVPQAYLNYRRKSTFGWSIGNILLDFTGGLLSIGQ
eukprot:00035.XXX_1143_1_1 [CDS] Oithona nana genome sequencing.